MAAPVADMGVSISPVNIEDRVRVDVRPGDTVRVWVKVEEKGKTRLQPFEGLVLARKHGTEPGATFTVRRVAGGYGVEKIFPLYSPIIDKIEIIKRAKVRRAKLYHIREKAARAIKRQMRNMRFVDIATMSDTEEKQKAEKAKEEAEAKAKEEEEKKAAAKAEDGSPTATSSEEESTRAQQEAGPKTSDDVRVEEEEKAPESKENKE